MTIRYFRCQASTDHTTYQNKNNLNKNNLLCLYDYQYCCCYLDLLELEQSRNISVGYTNLIHLIQMRSYKSFNDIPTIHVTITIINKGLNNISREYINNREWPINTKDCLFFANKQSLLLRTSTRSPTCKTTHRTLVWSIKRSRMILVISNVFWEVNHLKTTLKLS